MQNIVIGDFESKSTMERRYISFKEQNLSMWSDDFLLHKTVLKRLGNRFKHFIIYQRRIYCFQDSFAELYIYLPSDLENIETVHRCLGQTPPHDEDVCVSFDGKSRIFVMNGKTKNIHAISIDGKKWSRLIIKLPETISRVNFSGNVENMFFLFTPQNIFRIDMEILFNEEYEEEEEEEIFINCNDTYGSVSENISGIVTIAADLHFLIDSFKDQKKEEETEGEDESEEENNKKKDRKNYYNEIFLFHPKDCKVEKYAHGRTKSDILEYTLEHEFRLKRDWIGDLADQEFISFVEYSLLMKRRRETIKELQKEGRKVLLPPLKVKEPKIVFIKLIESVIRTIPIYVQEYEKALKKQEKSKSSWVPSFLGGGKDKKTKRIKRAHDVIKYYPIHIDHFERAFGSLEKEYKVNEYLKAVFMFFLFSNKNSYYSSSVDSKDGNEKKEEVHEYGLIYQILTIENTVEEAIEKIVNSKNYEDLPENYRDVHVRFSRELFASDLATNFGYDEIIHDKSYLSYFKTYKYSLTLIKPFFTTFNPTGFIEYLLKFFLFSKLGIKFWEGAAHIKQTETDLRELEKKLSEENYNSIFSEFKKKFVHRQSIFEWRRIQKYCQVNRGNSKFEINYEKFVQLLKMNIARVKNGNYEKREVEEVIQYFQKVQQLREKKFLMSEIKKEENQREFYEILSTFTPWLNEVYKLCDVSHVVGSWIGTVGRLIEVIEEERKYLDSKKKEGVEINHIEEQERKRILENELHRMFDGFTKELYKAFKNLFQNDINKNNLIRNTARWCKAVRNLITRNGNIPFHLFYFLEKNEKKASRLLLKHVENAFSMMNEEKDALKYNVIPPKE